MSELALEHCKPCEKGASSLSDQQLKSLMLLVPAWECVSCDETQVQQLRRVFEFANFVEAQEFTNRIGEIAEQENHHPAILLEWGRVSVRWWTHDIGGLHRNDFIMAAKTDALFVPEASSIAPGAH